MKFINVVLCLSSAALCCNASSFASTEAEAVEAQDSSTSTSSCTGPRRPTRGVSRAHFPMYPDLGKLSFATMAADLDAQIARLTEWLTFCQGSDARTVKELFYENSVPAEFTADWIESDAELRNVLAATVARGRIFENFSNFWNFNDAELKDLLESAFSEQIEQLKKVKEQHTALERSLLELGTYQVSTPLPFDANNESTKL